MANLVATTATTLSSTVVSSPITTLTHSYAVREFGGSVYINAGSSSDILLNTDGYTRLVGNLYVSSALAGISNMFAIADFHVSRYGVGYETRLISDWGSYSLSHYQDPGNVNNNYLRFTNTNGVGGTFYFAITVNSVAPSTSSVLTRIK
jgi:hypothetical protein